MALSRLTLNRSGVLSIAYINVNFTSGISSVSFALKRRPRAFVV
jgi:hypothetical protein